MGLGMTTSTGRLAESAVHRGPRVKGASGRKRHAYETFAGHQFDTHGRLMRKTQVIHRADDRYSESVVNDETGEVVRLVDERLSAHTGHGSAKFMAAQSLEPLVQTPKDKS